MTTAFVVALLAGTGSYLVLHRGSVRVIVGFVLLGHAAVVLLVASAGGDRRGVPLLDQVADVPLGDPVPQAFALTAVVIAFAVTLLLLGVLRAQGAAADDDAEDAEVEEQAGADAGRVGGHGDSGEVGRDG
ncbi:sodium:proton antiporter [Pseudokineococcus sp. 1T1Z-3]|uniref:sodium:proton antiporter n=1 Tax=Pseudokineococcus sp. 1T1Z-3 TaxID=3132745 RepID=UPI00309A32AC